MKKTIFYIDDQSYAIPQLIDAIPKDTDYELVYVQRICDIPEKKDFSLVILDFYLDKDKATALDIVRGFTGNTILSFSSSKEKNTLMLGNGAQHACEKLKDTNENKKLKSTLKKIFAENP